MSRTRASNLTFDLPQNQATLGLEETFNDLDLEGDEEVSAEEDSRDGDSVSSEIENVATGNRSSKLGRKSSVRVQFRSNARGLPPKILEQLLLDCEAFGGIDNITAAKAIKKRPVFYGPEHHERIKNKLSYWKALPRSEFDALLRGLDASSDSVSSKRKESKTTKKPRKLPKDTPKSLPLQQVTTLVDSPIKTLDPLFRNTVCYKTPFKSKPTTTMSLSKPQKLTDIAKRRPSDVYKQIRKLRRCCCCC